MFVFSIDFKPF